MAKETKKTTKKEEVKEEEVILVSEDTAKKVKETKNDKEEVVLMPNVTEPVIAKNVKIQMKVDHKCYIGGEWYYLLKGKQYNVPENVKEILLGSDLLQPL